MEKAAFLLQLAFHDYGHRQFFDLCVARTMNKHCLYDVYNKRSSNEKGKREEVGLKMD